ncbi:MAG TPA: ABC transporter permease [Acidimicrobiales bacterium]|nr:ABC transporter permease [Acidimicrobiales bacterium]
MTQVVRELRLTPHALSLRGALSVVERHVLSYRKSWVYIVSGFFEPFFYLLGIGIGLGRLVGSLTVSGHPVSYAVFVAPGLLASSAMNGAVFDATYNFFYRLKVEKTYAAMLATPLRVIDIATGELGWTLIRGMIYATGFLLVMAGFGYCDSYWAIACLPGAALISLAFGSIGLAVTSFMKSWQDIGSVSLAMLPMFLFSGTFYGLGVYPGWFQVVVKCSPLYQGVSLLRAFDIGAIDPFLFVHVAYLVSVTLVGMWVVSARLRRVLTP